MKLKTHVVLLLWPRGLFLRSTIYTIEDSLLFCDQ